MVLLPTAVLLYFLGFDCASDTPRYCLATYWRGEFWGSGGEKSPGSLLEAAYFLGGILGGAAALVGTAAAYLVAGIARNQLRAANDARRGDALLEVDAQWSSPQYRAARAALHEALRVSNGDFVGHLADIRGSDYEHYLVLHEIPDLFETVSLLVRQGYVRFDDVEKLLGGPVLQIYDLYHDQIEAMRGPHGPGYSAHIYENFEWLRDEIKRSRRRSKQQR